MMTQEVMDFIAIQLNIYCKKGGKGPNVRATQTDRDKEQREETVGD